MYVKYTIFCKPLLTINLIWTKFAQTCNFGQHTVYVKEITFVNICVKIGPRIKIDI